MYNEWLDYQDKMNAVELYHECFPEDSFKFIDYYFVNKLFDSKMIAKIHRKEVVSMISLNPFNMVLNGISFKSFYLVAVATKEKFRHQGFMADLLKEVDQFAIKNNIPFVFLEPVDPKIYEPFGFKYISKQYTQKYSVDKACDIIDEYFENNAELNVYCEPINNGNKFIEASAFINNMLSIKANLYVDHNPHYLMNVKKEFQTENGDLIGVYLDNDKSELIGTFLYWGNENVEIYEPLYNSQYKDEFHCAILDYILNKNSNVKTIELVGLIKSKNSRKKIMMKVEDTAAFDKILKDANIFTGLSKKDFYKKDIYDILLNNFTVYINDVV